MILWRGRQQTPPKRRLPFTNRYSVIFHNTWIFKKSTMETSDGVVVFSCTFQYSTISLYSTLSLSNGEGHRVSLTFLLRSEIETFCEPLFSVRHNKSANRKDFNKSSLSTSHRSVQNHLSLCGLPVCVGVITCNFAYYFCTGVTFGISH
jgi:hypothetical protein